MSTNDWKSALAALSGTLTDGTGPYTAAAASPAEAEPPKPRLTVTLDRKRAGKTATIIYGFDPADPRADALAAILKKRLATGGSARGGEILVQGDRVEAVKNILKAEGYRF